MTAQEMMMILGPSLAGGIGSAVNNSQQNKQLAQGQQNNAVQQQLQMLAQKAQILQGLQQNRQQQAQSGLNAMPLGQEQAYASRAKAMQALLPMLAKYQNARPTDPGIAGATRSSGPNLVQGLAGNQGFQNTFSDQMTSQAMADRRKAVAGVNPDYEFSSLGGYGMDAGYDQGVNAARSSALGRLEGFEGQQKALADQQVQLAMQPTQQQEEKKKGGGIMGFLGGALKMASPLAALIPGVGPLAAVGLGAAGGALGNKMQGGGLVSGAAQGALGAGIGAAGKSLAGGQGLNPFNNGAGNVMNNAMTSASLPQMGIGAPGPQLQLQNSMPQQMMTPFKQGAQQQAPQMPQLPMFNKADPRGGQQPPQQMPQPPIPFMPSHGSQQQGQQQPSTNIFGQQRTPQLQQMMDQIMGTGIAKGYTQGGLNMGMMPGMAGMGALQPPANPNPQGWGPGTQAWSTQGAPQGAPAPVGPIQSRQAQQNIQNILGQLGKNNGVNNAAFNDAAQGAYKAVPGNITQQLDPNLLKAIMDADAKRRAMMASVVGGQ